LAKFNVLEHELVPKHEILSEEEKKELLKKYNITEKQLPKILASDPVVKAIGAKPGDVIRIIRNSHVAGRSVYYRIVVEG
jgi:DNA-directed RNA polymerase subunit H